MKHYAFVDYATQAYAALVGLLILFFHNDTVPHWPWLVGVHAANLALVHGLVTLHARTKSEGRDGAKPEGRNPKAERRPKSETRKRPLRRAVATFLEGYRMGRLRYSDFGLPSAFGTRVSDLGQADSAPRAHGKALDFLRHFYPVLLYIWFFAETGWLNRMFFKEYLDPMVIGWDQALFGCQPSVLFMQKLPYLAVSELFYAAYFSYYVMIGGVGIALFVRDRRHFFHYISVVSFIFYICYLVYIVLPVIGPFVFFQDFRGYALPESVQQLAATHVYPEAVKSGVFYRVMTWIYKVFESPGAAIPSSHVAVAWTTVFFSFRYLRSIRFIHLGAAVLLCLATVYCRYHYAVDMLAGLVTAALLIPLGNWIYVHTSRS